MGSFNFRKIVLGFGSGVLIAFAVGAQGCGATPYETPLASSEGSQSLGNLDKDFASQVDSLEFKISTAADITAKLSILIDLDGSAQARGLEADPLCQRHADLNRQAVDELVVMIRALEFDFSKAQVDPAANTEVLSINGRAGERLAIHLLDGNVPTTQFVASNGSAFAAKLKNLEANLQRTCQ